MVPVASSDKPENRFRPTAGSVLVRCLILMILLMFIMTGVPVSAAGSGDPAGDSQPVTFTVLYNNDRSAPFREDWLILEEYRNRKQVLLDMRLGDDDNYSPTLTEVLDSGIVPDIVLKVYPEVIEPYASSGLLLAFSDYEEHLPHFRSYVADHQLETELDALRAANGKYYILPGFQRPIQVQQWVYRKDLFDKHQLGVPSTFEELARDLAYLKTLFTEAAPITASWGGAHLMAMLGASFGIPAGWNGNRYYNRAADSWQYAPATPNARALYTFLHNSYRDGLLDPAIYTQDFAEYLEKLTSGKAFVTATWITSGLAPWNEELEKSGVPEGEWAPLPVPESPLGIRALPPNSTFRKGLIVPASAADKPYFSRLLEFLDWAIYSEEGIELTSWGVEGITFAYNNDGSRSYLPGISAIDTPDAEKTIKRDFGLDAVFNLNEDSGFVDSKRPEEINAFLLASLDRGDTAFPAPGLKLTSIQLQALKNLSVRLDAYAADAIIQLVTGGLDPERDWDRYIEELENRGYKSVELIWNSAWQAGR
jgi:putative aldouronate transport system substrate-binding protein